MLCGSAPSKRVFFHGKLGHANRIEQFAGASEAIQFWLRALEPQGA